MEAFECRSRMNFQEQLLQLRIITAVNIFALQMWSQIRQKDFGSADIGVSKLITFHRIFRAGHAMCSKGLA